MILEGGESRTKVVSRWFCRLVEQKGAGSSEPEMVVGVFVGVPLEGGDWPEKKAVALGDWSKQKQQHIEDEKKLGFVG